MKEIAFFDFDGTISTKDSTKSFYKYILGRKFLYCYYFKFIWKLAKMKLKLESEFDLKRKRVVTILGKYKQAEIEELSQEYTINILSKIIKESALDRIKWHKKLGHEVCIVSASFDICLAKWCVQEGLNLLTNELEYINSYPSGKFKSKDCNGIEKVTRIKSKYDIVNYKAIHAYGDTPNDYPMLDIATYSYYNYFK